RMSIQAGAYFLEKAHGGLGVLLGGVPGVEPAKVLVIGGGTVGQAAAKALTDRGVEWRMVETNPDHRPAGATDEQFILGDARDEDVLRAAGIEEAPTVLITPENDALNIYLTILCRKLCSSIQVVVRALTEAAVPTLHKAGADFVMSTASLGASRTINLLRRDSIVPIAEGLNIWRVTIPESLAGKRLADVPVRARTDVTVVAVIVDEAMDVNPDANEPLPATGELLLIGDKQAEAKFDELYAHPD
ncbi:MAG: NAD-binding protein, partial [Planctomycetota bacterium]